MKTAILLLLLFFPIAGLANIVQSQTITFPKSGRVLVQAHEIPGEYPRLVFVSEKTRKVIWASTISDDCEHWLLFDPSDSDSHSQLRFRTIRSSGYKEPIIMSVGVMHGGSDDAFYLTLFGEHNGRIKRLTPIRVFANIQGGYYVGYLNRKLGFGLACWNFIWGHSREESHYSLHRYRVEIFKIRRGEFQRVRSTSSRRMYRPDKAAASLREFGIAGLDQRIGIPVIRDIVKDVAD